MSIVTAGPWAAGIAKSRGLQLPREARSSGRENGPDVGTAASDSTPFAAPAGRTTISGCFWAADFRSTPVSLRAPTIAAGGSARPNPLPLTPPGFFVVTEPGGRDLALLAPGDVSRSVGFAAEADLLQWFRRSRTGVARQSGFHIQRLMCRDAQFPAVNRS